MEVLTGFGLTICPKGPIFVRAIGGASSGREIGGADRFSTVGMCDGVDIRPCEVLPGAGVGDGAERLNVPKPIASGKPKPSFAVDDWF